LFNGRAKHEGAEACRNRQPAASQTDGNAATKRSRFNPAIPLSEELMMKEGNGLLIANILGAKVGGDVLFQEMQRRSLEAGQKIRSGQEHRTARALAAAQNGFTNLFDLPIGKPIKLAKDK
jgi:hypothetical protein